MTVDIRAVSCGMIQENAYIVRAEGRGDCVVVDPGDDYPKLKRALGDLRVAAILLTHGHFDHILAVGAMAAETGAPVYVHPDDAQMLNDAGKNGYLDLMDGAAMPGPAVDALALGERLNAAGMDFEVLHTPGHSRGSVCLYLPGEGALFSGDTLFCCGYGRLDLHGGSSADMARSLKALFALPGGVRVYPGHGGATTIGEERARYSL